MMLKILLMVIFPANAYAYLDPVTGSLVIQAAISGVVTGVFLIKLYWKKLIVFCKRACGKEQAYKDDIDNEK